MNLEDRMARRRQLALIEAQGLVSMHQITVDDLDQLESELAERREALAGRIAEVKALMTALGISLEDILDEGPINRGHVTHRHPVTGQTWNGVGAQPEWLRSALLTEGYRPADLRVSGCGSPGHEA
jgi:DNA-binding protein H-NS